MDDIQFQENLRIGTEAEDMVYTWLKLHHAYVQDMRYQTHDKGSGPRLEGKLGSIILPDFAFYDRYKGKYLLDVKYKTKDFFTVDDYKMHDYLKAVNLLGMDGLQLVFVYENEKYFYDSSEKIGPLKFNNAYGKAAYKFEFDRSKIKK